jgi:transmembrane sensor
MESSSEVPDSRIVDAVRQAASYRPEDFSAGTEPSLAKVRARIESLEREQTAARFRPRVWVPLLAAAAVVIVVAGTMLRSRTSPDVTSTFVASRGQRLTFTLADGSEMMLAPESRATFAVSQRNRRISLEGEAFFRVKHDASRPFSVVAGNATATDIGTEFIVRSYREEESVDVAVTAGSVRVASKVNKWAPIVRQGEVARVDRAGTTTVSHYSEANSYVGWITGRLVFRDEPLSSITIALSRWFNTDISVSDPQLARQRLSAVYDQPTLDGVLAALAAATGARIQKSGSTIRLVPDKNT